MFRISLTASALDMLARDPVIRRWQEGKIDGKVPLLRYFYRCYSTLRDGTIVEHGDGFSLSLVKPDDARSTDETAYEDVALPQGGNILVGVDRSVLKGDFSIGWVKSTFTFEPQSPS